MVSLVLGLFLCVALALAVVGLVAVPARRAGREVLTERGEEVLGSIRDRQLLPARFGRTADADESDADALDAAGEGVEKQPVGAGV
jgi:hypothetical protein